MGLDYYGVLGLTKNCEDLDIKKHITIVKGSCALIAAFKNNMSRFRKIITENFNCNALEKDPVKFNRLAEAYEVLSEPCRRAIYDQYGEEGLKNGVPTTDGFIIPYVYHGDWKRTLTNFFGILNPYGDLLDYMEKLHPLFKFSEGQGIKKRDAPLRHTLALSLYEIFHGGLKKMKIQRREFIDDSQTATKIGEKILTIPIKPGLPIGTEFVFKEVGDDGHSIIPADVIFITEDKPHPVFTREGADLYTNSHINLEQALNGIIIQLETLDHRLLRIPITEVARPGYRKIIQGEGVPLVNEPQKRGDLIITFSIEFPKHLPRQSKKLITKALSEVGSVRNNTKDSKRNTVIVGTKINGTIKK